MSEPMPHDPYRDWSYTERREARYSDDPGKRADRRGDSDSESSDRAYDSWRSGGEFSDPNPEGRFH